MINEQGDPNRPPIEQVIDRSATLFRNNQFGSNFDNVDFLGLKKQEEDKIKNELRQTQLRQTAVETGTSMGVVNYRLGTGETPPLSYGGRTPRGAYNADGFDTPTNDVNMSDEPVMRIRAEMEAFNIRRQEAQQASSSSSARVDLDEAHRQSLPVGVMDNDEFEDMQPSDDELIPAEDTVRPYQKSVLYFNNDIEAMKKNQSLEYTDLLFQLYVRGRLTDDISKRVEDLPDEISKTMYLLTVVEELIGDGNSDNNWQIGIESNLLSSRIGEWRQMQRGGGKGILRKFLESVGSVVLDAGKEVARDALIAGAQNAVMSLL